MNNDNEIKELLELILDCIIELKYRISDINQQVTDIDSKLNEFEKEIKKN